MTALTTVLAKAKLSELCTLVTDGTHDTPKRVEAGFPLIKAKEIVGGRIDFDTCDQISLEDHVRVIARSKPEKGDTLFAHIGASLGEAAYVNTDKPFSIKNIALFKPDPSKIKARYLYYLVVSPEFQALAKGARTGSAQPFLSLGHLRAHPLRYHEDIAEQDRIASILGAYDDLIEVNRRRIALLEEMARRLFEEWFVRFLFPGPEGHAMVETPDGPLPEGWRREQLGNLCAEIRDAVSPADIEGDTPYVGLEHIPRRSITLNSWGHADEVTSTKLHFRVGDVLFGKIRPYFHKVVFAPFDGVSSSDAIVIRSQPEQRGLVLSVISSDQFVAHSVATSNGTKMPRANWNVLARTIVPIGPKHIMGRFNQTILTWVELAASLNGANKRLAASRDLLLPRLISGELSVASAERELEAVA